MSIRNDKQYFIDFLRLPRPQGKRRKSIYHPWSLVICIDFQAILEILLIIPDTHFKR